MRIMLLLVWPYYKDLGSSLLINDFNIGMVTVHVRKNTVSTDWVQRPLYNRWFWNHILIAKGKKK